MVGWRRTNGAGGRLAGSVSWGIVVQMSTQCVEEVSGEMAIALDRVVKRRRSMVGRLRAMVVIGEAVIGAFSAAGMDGREKLI